MASTGCKPTRASLGACRPPCPGHDGWASPVAWQKSDVGAPDVRRPRARCQMPAGKARAWAGSPDLLRVRANPWLSRNTQEPRHPHTPGWHKVGGTGAQGPLRRQRRLAKLTPSPAAQVHTFPSCCSCRPGLIAAPNNESKHSPAFSCAQTPWRAWDPAGCCRLQTRKASADALRCFPALAAPVAGLEKQENICRARQMSGSWGLPRVARWHGVREEVRKVGQSLGAAS